nr:uncharacterized protein LOC125423995 isoform X2 [Ziziphus jujuba var. spinosa]
MEMICDPCQRIDYSNPKDSLVGDKESPMALRHEHEPLMRRMLQLPDIFCPINSDLPCSCGGPLTQIVNVAKGLYQMVLFGPTFTGVSLMVVIHAPIALPFPALSSSSR